MKHTRTSRESQRGRPQQQALWWTVTDLDSDTSTVWWRTTRRWRTPAQTPSSRPSSHQPARYALWLVAQRVSRLCHVATSVFVRPSQKRWNARDMDVPSAGRTFAWSCIFSDVRIVAIRYVNLALPILCLLDFVCCMLLHIADSILRTFPVLTFLRCCLFDNDWRTTSFRI